MRVWGSVNRKPDAGGAVYSVWKNEDRKWTIDEVVAYYGLELDADIDVPASAISMEGVVCPSYLRDELKAEIEHKHVEVGERYNAGLLWSRDALAAGMEPTEVHELVQSAFLRWGYDSEKAERQAWNAQSGTVDKLSRGELSFDSRLRPAVDFPDDALMAEEEPLASGAAEAQAVSMGLADLATGLGEAGDQFTWLKENMSRVAKLGALELARVRAQWTGGARDFNNAVKEYLASEEEEEDWAQIASRFLEGRHMVLVDDVWYQWQGTFYEGVDDMHIKKDVSDFIKAPSVSRVGNAYQRSSSPA